MSAYVIVEFTVKDPDVVREKYSPNAAQTVKEHGGEVLAANVDWEILYGDPLFRSGVLNRFPDHETAVRWYKSPEYQQLIDDRSVAMDARFSLLDGLPADRGGSRSRLLTDTEVLVGELPRRRENLGPVTVSDDLAADARSRCRLVGPTVYGGLGRVRRASLLQEASFCLADLDQVTVGIAQVATKLWAAIYGRGQEQGSFGTPVFVDLLDVGDAHIQEAAGRIGVGSSERYRRLVFGGGTAHVDDDPGVRQSDNRGFFVEDDFAA